jgi:hypothetical protein
VTAAALRDCLYGRVNPRSAIPTHEEDETNRDLPRLFVTNL